MKNLFTSGLLLASLCALAQDTSVLEEVIITSGRLEERRRNIVQKIDVIPASRIAQINAQNTGDLLFNTGNVFVQKSQQGGSSPVLRGFEASRVLLVVDGVRMNNAVYRAGHLQNVITIDQNMLERVEVLYGPASTLYGSDALGGVVHFVTKRPKLSPGNGTLTTGSAFVRYSSANSEKTGHADLSIGSRKWAWLQSYNFSDFGDLRMGGKYRDDYPDFGKRSRYIDFIGGVDSVVRNEDDRIQRFSGYRQWDMTQKVLYRGGDRATHTLNLQVSNSSDVPRYDRLQDVRNGALRFAEWYYGPQFRTLAAYDLQVNGLGPFDDFRAILSYQHIKESRHQREYRRYDRLDNRLERIGVWALTADARRRWGAHELTLGTDAQLNDVTSEAFQENILTGARSPLDSRYPNGGSTMNTFGLYAQHVYKWRNGKIVLNDGLRFQGTVLKARIADNSFFNFPFTAIDQRNSAVTGNLGLVYNAADRLRISGGVSTGFRSPNVDDLARIFESNTAARQLVVPNPDVDPEYTTSFDLTLALGRADGPRVEVTGFYTLFRNAITLVPFRFNGQDSILYNGARVAVYANSNAASARIRGVQAALTAPLGGGLTAASTFSYTHGRYRRSEGTEVPLDHIPPVFGRTALQYAKSRFHGELYAIYNGWKRIDDYSPSGEDNAQYATPDGTPSWYTLNLKTSCRVTAALQLQLGVENLLDRNYRVFASGFSAPGRNVIVALRGNL